MIKVFCYTNLDDFKKEEWPSHFTCRPEVGDKVASKSGKVLTIKTICHAERKTDKAIVGGTQYYMEFYLSIELGKTFTKSM